jgi:hypothetical protein
MSASLELPWVDADISVVCNSGFPDLDVLIRAVPLSANQFKIKEAISMLKLAEWMQEQCKGVTGIHGEICKGSSWAERQSHELEHLVYQVTTGIYQIRLKLSPFESESS